MNQANKERFKSIILFLYITTIFLWIRSLYTQPEYDYLSSWHRLALDMVMTVFAIFVTYIVIDILKNTYRWIKLYIKKDNKSMR